MKVKEYVLSVVRNEVNPKYTEYDERSYYRCYAKTQKDAYKQAKRDVPHLVFCEVIKINY